MELKIHSPMRLYGVHSGYFAFTYRDACFRSKKGKHERRKGEEPAKIVCKMVPLRTVVQKTRSLIRQFAHIVKKSSPSVKIRKVRYCDHKSPSDIPNRSHINPVHSLSIFLWKPLITLSSQLRIGFPGFGRL